MSIAVAITPVSTEIVHIASCPIHGLHGQRTVCFAYEHEGLRECDGTVEQIPMVPVEIVRGSPCACGCRRPQRGQSAYHEDACRTRHWKEMTGYVDPRSSSAPNGPNGGQLRLLRSARPGGRQVSYRRAVRVLAKYLERRGIVDNSDQAERVAAQILRGALPARQRKSHASARRAA